MDKIPASIGILTLNSGQTLRACLESVKDFAEIIICDGNSTDNTLEIAREYGAKIIKQYETDEPNLTCVTDKANVRQKNMEAASYDWYFFMDSDDTLSPEVVEEIRRAAEDPEPAHLVWKMPTKIFIGEREIKRASIYPSFQIRFINRKINPRFRNQVHDRLVFDKKYAVGTLQNFYEYHWPESRVKNYWQFLKKYVGGEVATTGNLPLASFFLIDIFRPLKTAFGYLLWRIPRVYLKYGFKNSMPWTVEFNLLVRYNFSLVYHLLKKLAAETLPVTFIAEIWRKKNVERILVNIALRKKEIYGKMLDIGNGDGRASHYRFLKMVKWARIYTADISPASNPHYVLDIERDPLPLTDGSFDFVLIFNLLEHLKSRDNLLNEAKRILKDGQKIIGSVPFLMDVHPDPHDYFRFSKEQLQIIFSDAGFKNIKIEAIGRGPFLAGYYQIDFLTPRIIKMLILPVVGALDALLQLVKPKIKFREKYPLAYVFEATKQISTPACPVGRDDSACPPKL